MLPPKLYVKQVSRKLWWLSSPTDEWRYSLRGRSRTCLLEKTIIATVAHTEGLCRHRGSTIPANHRHGGLTQRILFMGSWTPAFGDVGGHTEEMTS